MSVPILVIDMATQVWHLSLEVVKHQPVLVVDVVQGELWKVVASDSEEVEVS